MAKKHGKGNGPKYGDFYAAFKRGPVSKKRFDRMRAFAKKRVNRRIAEKEKAFDDWAFKYYNRSTRPLENYRWRAETTLALEEYWAHQYAAKALEAEFELAKTILDQQKAFGKLIGINPQQIGWAMRRIEEAPRAEIIESEQAASFARKYKRKKEALDFEWKNLQRIAKSNPAINKKLGEISRRLSVLQNFVEDAEKNFDPQAGSALALLTIDKITQQEYYAILKKLARPLNKRKARYYSLLENWWILWNNIARNSRAKFSKTFFMELARQRHNATEEKNKASKALQ